MTRHRFYERYVKRTLDIVFSFLMLILLSPLMLILVAAVRAGIGSPAIFKQERPGRNAKIFKLYKFRTMTEKKDENGELLPDEQRTPRFGRLLRASSLDELPQLFNILRGEMSFVGPRPLLCEYLPLYTERQAHRHDVRPGLTGLAQITGRNTLKWEEKFEYDVEYVENLSFANDMKIIFNTVKTVLCREGITPENKASVEKFTGATADPADKQRIGF